MPMVNGKKYPYTEKGKKAAAAAKKKQTKKSSSRKKGSKGFYVGG
jgi:hypothetical protein